MNNPTKKHQDGPCGYLGDFCMCKCRDSRGEAEDVASTILKYNNRDVAQMGTFSSALALGERVKTTESCFGEAKSTKQGVEGAGN